MLGFILMKAFESAPKRYDLGISLISLGTINKVKEKIANDFISSEDKVLDIGCGTGTLAIMMASIGANVSGFDISNGMLQIAEQKIKATKLDNRIKLMRLGVTEMESNFQDNSFDKVISTLVLSELSNDEQRYVLEESKRILKKNGLLIVADEVRPNSALSRVIHLLIRLPLGAITFILAQSLTHSVKDLERKIKSVGLKVKKKETRSWGSFEILVAEKIR